MTRWLDWYSRLKIFNTTSDAPSETWARGDSQVTPSCELSRGWGSDNVTLHTDGFYPLTGLPHQIRRVVHLQRQDDAKAFPHHHGGKTRDAIHCCCWSSCWIVDRIHCWLTCLLSEHPVDQADQSHSWWTTSSSTTSGYRCRQGPVECKNRHPGRTPQHPSSRTATLHVVPLPSDRVSALPPDSS